MYCLVSTREEQVRGRKKTKRRKRKKENRAKSGFVSGDIWLGRSACLAHSASTLHGYLRSACRHRPTLIEAGSGSCSFSFFFFLQTRSIFSPPPPFCLFRPAFWYGTKPVEPRPAAVLSLIKTFFCFFPEPYVRRDSL